MLKTNGLCICSLKPKTSLWFNLVKKRTKRRLQSVLFRSLKLPERRHQGISTMTYVIRNYTMNTIIKRYISEAK